MQIQLKQSEIVTALRNYISDQGINLTGKDVDVKFTAGRKEAGISADIDIEDAVVKVNIDNRQVAAGSTSNVVSMPAVLTTAGDDEKDLPFDLGIVTGDVPAEPVAEPEAEAVEAEAKTTGTSLFG